MRSRVGERESISTKKSGSVLQVVFLTSSLGEGESGREKKEEDREEKLGEGEHALKAGREAGKGGKGGEVMGIEKTLPELSSWV